MTLAFALPKTGHPNCRRPDKVIDAGQRRPYAKEQSTLTKKYGAKAVSQNKLSVLIEQMAELPALHKLVAKYVDAEDTYMPSYPPMSPLSKTYFTSWGAFDLCSGGIQKETFCTIATDFCKLEGFADIPKSLPHSEKG